MRDGLGGAVRDRHAAEIGDLEADLADAIDELAALQSTEPVEVPATPVPVSPPAPVIHTLFGDVPFDHPGLVPIGTDGCFPDLYLICIGSWTYQIPEEIIQADYEACLAQTTDPIECGP